MKSCHQQRIESFMRMAGQHVPVAPQVPPVEVRELRARLILEEALETIAALGFEAVIRRDYGPDYVQSIHQAEDVDAIDLQPNDAFDLVGTIDGCCDLSVVTIGTLSAFGVPDEVFLAEVDANNLAKFGPGHSVRADGKLVKPANHKPPRIAELLSEMGCDEQAA